MLNVINNFLNGFIGTCLGVFMSSSIYKYYDFKTHPDLYVINSEPWYTSIEIQAMLTAIICVVALVIKYLIKRKLKSV